MSSLHPGISSAKAEAASHSKQGRQQQLAPRAPGSAYLRAASQGQTNVSCESELKRTIMALNTKSNCARGS